MLPIPFINYIPKLFKNDTKAVALANKIDIDLKAWKKDTLDIARLIRADECPVDYLNELNFILSAGFKSYDSEPLKRQKIITAIENHKKRTLWINDIKTKIDAITGYSAVIMSYKDASQDDWIEMAGDEEAWFQNGSYCIESADNTSRFAFIELGRGDEVYVAGNFYIFPHPQNPNPILPIQTINQIVNEIYDDLPQYYRVYLAYSSPVNLAYPIYKEIT